MLLIILILVIMSFIFQKDSSLLTSLTSPHWLVLNTFSLFSILLFSPTRKCPAAALDIHTDGVVHSDHRSCHERELKLPSSKCCSPFPLWVQVHWLLSSVGSCSICSLRCGCAEEPHTWLSLIPEFVQGLKSHPCPLIRQMDGISVQLSVLYSGYFCLSHQGSVVFCFVRQLQFQVVYEWILDFLVKEKYASILWTSCFANR